MENSIGRAVGHEGALLLLCLLSDMVPATTVISGFLDSHGAIWRAIVDNASHAGIAGASWMVVVSLSPPCPATEGLLKIALPGSPVHRCYSFVRQRTRGKRCRNHRRDILPLRTPPPPPPALPPSPPPVPYKTVSMEHADDAGEIFDAESLQGPPTTRRPVSRGSDPPAAKESSPRAVVAEVVLAACIGSLLDLDHFFAAGSLRLSEATGLAGRPWGHCVMALLVVALATVALTYNARVGVAAFVGGSSHQLRDATRRGLWMYPPRGPKTRPLPYAVYLLAQMLLPILASMCLRSGVGSSCHRCVRGYPQRRRPWQWPCAHSRGRYRMAGARLRKGDEEENAKISSLPL